MNGQGSLHGPRGERGKVMLKTEAGFREAVPSVAIKSDTAIVHAEALYLGPHH